MPILIIGIILYAISSSMTDSDEVVKSIGAIDLRVLSIVLALSLLNYGLRFWRWSLLLGDPPHALTAGRHFTIYMAGFALTTTPGKIGEALRIFYLRSFGIPPSRSLAALYAERLFDLMVISLLAMLIFTSSGLLARSLGFVGAGMALALIALQHPAAVALLQRVAARFPSRRIGAALQAIVQFLRDVRSMMTVPLVAAGTLLGLLAWGAEGIGAYLVAQALGLDISLWLAIGIYATAMLAGALSFLPGGLGSTEVVMISLFAYAGATLPVAVAATAIIRLATLWFAVALGLGAWFGLETFRGPMPAASGRISGREH